jgi:hypothetical protein
MQGPSLCILPCSRKDIPPIFAPSVYGKPDFLSWTAGHGMTHSFHYPHKSLVHCTLGYVHMLPSEHHVDLDVHETWTVLWATSVCCQASVTCTLLHCRYVTQRLHSFPPGCPHRFVVFHAGIEIDWINKTHATVGTMSHAGPSHYSTYETNRDSDPTHVALNWNSGGHEHRTNIIKSNLRGIGCQTGWEQHKEDQMPRWLSRDKG